MVQLLNVSKHLNWFTFKSKFPRWGKRQERANAPPAPERNPETKIHPLHHDKFFHPSLLPFLFDWWIKRWEITEEVSLNCMAYAYYDTLMTKYTCTWLHHPLKLLPSTYLLCTDSSQPGLFHVETYMRILGLWFANTIAAKITIKWVGG